MLLAAVTWAEQHPPESIAGAATWPARGGECRAGAGGRGRAAGGGVLHRRVRGGDRPVHRLRAGRDRARGRAEVPPPPPLGTACSPATLEPWRARRIAEATLGLSPEAAAYVDAQLAPFAHKVGPAQLDRLVERGHRPLHARQAAARTPSARPTGGTSPSTTSRSPSTAPPTSRPSSTWPTPSTSTPPSPHGAEQLKARGIDESLDVRRAMAAGDLARRQLALDLAAASPTASDGDHASRRGRSCSTSTSPRPRSPAHGRAAGPGAGGEPPPRPSPPTRSAPGAPTPTPRSSSSR